MYHAYVPDVTMMMLLCLNMIGDVYATYNKVHEMATMHAEALRTS